MNKERKLQEQINSLKEQNANLLESIEKQFFTFKTTQGNEYSIFDTVRKETAKEILSYVGNLDDDGEPMKCYLWFVNLCKKYDVEVEDER